MNYERASTRCDWSDADIKVSYIFTWCVHFVCVSHYARGAARDANNFVLRVVCALLEFQVRTQNALLISNCVSLSMTGCLRSFCASNCYQRELILLVFIWLWFEDLLCFWLESLYTDAFADVSVPIEKIIMLVATQKCFDGQPYFCCWLDNNSVGKKCFCFLKLNLCNAN